jgi:hypothetical protein
MTLICNKCGRPAFITIACEITIFALNGSQGKRIMKFDLCDIHMANVEGFCRKKVGS